MSNTHHWMNPGGYTISRQTPGRPFQPQNVELLPAGTSLQDAIRRVASGNIGRDGYETVDIYEGGLHVHNGRVDDSTLAATVTCDRTGYITTTNYMKERA